MAVERDDEGRFSEKLRDQEILKVFDYADDPMLAAKEVAHGLHAHFGIEATPEAIRRRLGSMEEDELVASKEFGARATGWHALVAPALAEDVAAEVEARRDADRDEFVTVDS